MTDSPSSSRVAFAPLLRAAEGLTQWRPLLLGFATWLLCAALMAAGMYLASRIGLGFGAAVVVGMSGLLVAVLAASGFSGVGVMLMDKARGTPVRSMTDALLAGLLCLPKLIGFALVLLAVVLALALVGVVVYFVCKLPGLGPLLLFVAHPVLVLLAAVVFTTVGWVALPLFMPAVWDGRGFKEALSLVIAVARSRLMQVVALLLALYVVVAIVGMLVSAALLPGYAFMTGLAASMLGLHMGGLSSLMGVMAGYGMEDSGLMAAGMLSSALIFGVVTTLMFQVFVMGLNLVYLSAADGIDLRASQQMLDAGIAQAREKAREAQERARQAAEVAQAKAREAAERAQAKAREVAQHAHPAAPAAGVAPEPAAPAQDNPPPVADAPAAPVAALHCPQCHQAVGAQDLFCEHCGHRLEGH